MVLIAVLGFFGCAKKGQMKGEPGYEVEEVTGEPTPQVGRDSTAGVDEESLSARARQELQSRLEDIFFDFDKYNIRPDARVVLKRNHEALLNSPNAELLIEGHCDERGTVEYNLALGQRRANSARDYLISLGMSAAKLSTVSYGEEKPLDPGQNEQAWARNRRCHFVVLKSN
jgi:peptidoglycan-associated lipoprotein